MYLLIAGEVMSNVLADINFNHRVFICIKLMHTLQTTHCHLLTTYTFYRSLWSQISSLWETKKKKKKKS